MRKYFKLVQILILIGNSLLIANGLDFVGGVFMRGSPMDNHPRIAPSDPKDACKNCKSGTDTTIFEKSHFV